ncbi:CoA transferase [Lampropedia puyangensis]|uniref:CoA transferase n=1 Tax=Lampropedia puyangensis TaxID=1330072 RepID=A0A4S8FDL2_9BURK|nr:CaiB/BaiF CoA-transferase family protein [Lampropedia puyangensis]THU04002.1 CoA transferase [Lampropedia puyangensis]
MNTSASPVSPAKPLAGIRVIEFTHMVMGPACGMILADLGAEVIKVEPIAGDSTRTLLGAGAGFFPMFNRNKQSIGINLKDDEGLNVALKLCATADVVLHNFKPGVLGKFGLDYTNLQRLNPRLIYVNLTGFLPGPYEHRTALDEVVQMMGGLAYMTGRPGDPLRAGSSVNDIMGGMFGAIAALAALMQRNQTQCGQEIDAALFENNVFLVGQHMLQYQITGQAANPMPERISPWAIYDIFTVAEGEQIFLAAVSDAHWKTLCTVFQWTDLAAKAELQSNNERVRQRPSLLPELRARLQAYTADSIATLFEANGLPYARIMRPEQLFEDPHLLATQGLEPITLVDGAQAGQTVDAALLPIRMDGQRLRTYRNPPKLGEQTEAILQQLGFETDQITALRKGQSIC